MRPVVRNGGVMLKGLMPIHKKDGKTYWYLRRKGRPLIALPDLPHDDPAFLAAYAAAWSATPGLPQRPTGGIASACLAAMRSKRYMALSPAYRAALRNHFDAMTRDIGAAPIRGVRDAHIAKNLTTADNPTARLKAWRFMCSHAKDTGLIDVDPSIAVRTSSRPTTEGHAPWTADEIAAFRDRWPIGTAARAAMELLHWGGMRISDAVKVGRGMVDKDGVLTFRQTKTGDPAYVPWTCALPSYAARMQADRDMMHQAIAPFGGHMTFLATTFGSSRSDKALGTLIRTSARLAKVEKSAHGLRKSRAIALAEAGATTHQIGAWTGHKTLKEIEHYTQKASRRRAVMGEEQEQNSANTSA